MISRPLSQHGLPCVPSNAKARRHYYGAPRKRETLDKVNERLAGHGVTLHPTKGFRRINPFRTQAEIMAGRMRSGRMPYSMKRMRKGFTFVYEAMMSL